MSYLLIFIAGFISVFLLGFQSRAVNHDNWKLAFSNSLLIGFTQSNIWSLMDADRGWLAASIYGLAGACGIVSSMWVHKKLLVKWQKDKQ
jgi:hypothetical protein